MAEDGNSVENEIIEGVDVYHRDRSNTVQNKNVKRAKTASERMREYRARKRNQIKSVNDASTIIQRENANIKIEVNNYIENSSVIAEPSTQNILNRKRAKTAAERMREYRARIRNKIRRPIYASSIFPHLDSNDKNEENDYIENRSILFAKPSNTTINRKRPKTNLERAREYRARMQRKKIQSAIAATSFIHHQDANVKVEVTDYIENNSMIDEPSKQNINKKRPKTTLEHVNDYRARMHRNKIQSAIASSSFIHQQDTNIKVEATDYIENRSVLLYDTSNQNINNKAPIITLECVQEDRVHRQRNQIQTETETILPFIRHQDVNINVEATDYIENKSIVLPVTSNKNINNKAPKITLVESVQKDRVQMEKNQIQTGSEVLPFIHHQDANINVETTGHIENRSILLTEKSNQNIITKLPITTLESVRDNIVQIQRNKIQPAIVLLPFVHHQETSVNVKANDYIENRSLIAEPSNQNINSKRPKITLESGQVQMQRNQIQPAIVVLPVVHHQGANIKDQATDDIKNRSTIAEPLNQSVNKKRAKTGVERMREYRARKRNQIQAAKDASPIIKHQNVNIDIGANDYIENRSILVAETSNQNINSRRPKTTLESVQEDRVQMQRNQIQPAIDESPFNHHRNVNIKVEAPDYIENVSVFAEPWNEIKTENVQEGQ